MSCDSHHLQNNCFGTNGSDCSHSRLTSAVTWCELFQPSLLPSDSLYMPAVMDHSPSPLGWRLALPRSAWCFSDSISAREAASPHHRLRLQRQISQPLRYAYTCIKSVVCCSVRATVYFLHVPIQGYFFLLPLPRQMHTRENVTVYCLASGSFDINHPNLPRRGNEQMHLSYYQKALKNMRELSKHGNFCLAKDAKEKRKSY